MMIDWTIRLYLLGSKMCLGQMSVIRSLWLSLWHEIAVSLIGYIHASQTDKQLANLFDLAAADGAPVEASQRRDQAVRQQQDRRQEEEFQGAAPQANS